MRPRSIFRGEITIWPWATRFTSRACWTFWPNGREPEPLIYPLSPSTSEKQEERMTRLDSAIRRLTAQRDLLNWAAQAIGPTGLVLELGLGNGRTYDHL